MIAILSELDRRQPVLARLGWVMAAVLAFSLVAMVFDARSINGVSVWTKPAKFAASFVAWCWTLAWAWGVLAPAARRGWLAGLVLWGTVASGSFEVGWITLRAALGLPSHFATDALGGPMYGLMGLAAVLLVAMAALLGVLVLGGVLGGITGSTISVMGGPVIAGTLSDAASWPPFFWSRDGGDLRIAHFLGTHAMQALPAFALLAAPGAAAVSVAALGWLGVTLAAYALALAGVPIMP